MGLVDSIIQSALAGGSAQPSRPQQLAQSRPTSASGGNLMQVIKSIASNAVANQRQQQGQAAGGGGWNPVTQSEYRTNGPFAAGVASQKSDDAKKQDEKSIYSSESKKGRSNRDNDMFARAALGLVVPGAAEALNVGDAVSQIMGPEQAYAAEGEEGQGNGENDIRSSDGGKFVDPSMSTMDLATARSKAGLEGNQELRDFYGNELSDRYGVAAGVANPVGASISAIKGARAGLKARKAEKAAAEAAKLGEKAAKAKESAGIAKDFTVTKAGKAAKAAETGADAAKAGEAVAEGGKAAEAAGQAVEELLTRSEKAAKVAAEKGTKKAAADARRVARREANREKMLTNENGYFGSAAKNAVGSAKAAQAAENASGGILGTGMASLAGLGLMVPMTMATLGESGDLDEFMSKPLGGNLAQAGADLWKETGLENGYIGENIENPENPQDEDKDKNGGGIAQLMLDPYTGQPVWGLSREDWNKKEQRDQYAQALTDENFRNWISGFNPQYADDANGYEYFRDLDLGDKEEMLYNMLGYNGGQYELPGWRDMYSTAIYNATNGKERLTGDAEHDMPLIMDWIDDSAIDAGLAVDPTEKGMAYLPTVNLGIGYGSARNMSDYLIQKDAGDFYEGIRQATGNDYPYDNADLGTALFYENMKNNADKTDFSKYGQDNLDQLAALLNMGGDTAQFEFYEPAEGEEDSWRPNADYSYYNLANAAGTLKPEELAQYLPVYDDLKYVSNAIPADAADTILSDYSKWTGQHIRRKNSGKKNE